jgi:hypothetical protein
MRARLPTAVLFALTHVWERATPVGAARSADGSPPVDPISVSARRASGVEAAREGRDHGPRGGPQRSRHRVTRSRSRTRTDCESARRCDRSPIRSTRRGAARGRPGRWTESLASDRRGSLRPHVRDHPCCSWGGRTRSGDVHALVVAPARRRVRAIARSVSLLTRAGTSSSRRVPPRGRRAGGAGGRASRVGRSGRRRK